MRYWMAITVVAALAVTGTSALAQRSPAVVYGTGNGWSIAPTE